MTVLQSPEEKARATIDAMLRHAGWEVQHAAHINLSAGRGVAVREFPLTSGYGFADYLLYVDQHAVGVIEAKKEGTTLTGVESQAQKYSRGLPSSLPAPVRPLPFCYQSTGVETRFSSGIDPDPRSRRVFSFFRPETFATWIAPYTDTSNPLQNDHTVVSETAAVYAPTLRTRLRHLPLLITTGLWPAQIKAVQNLEYSLANDRPRALIQMATGSGKTFTAITSIYRLIRFANSRRVLFLVDRANLGRQALKEFQQYVTPDDGRKFTELYNVQHLTSNKLDPVARVCITTIQRLYSMLKGEEELDPSLEEGSQFDSTADLIRVPVPVVYNPQIPIETFDFIFIDGCHDQSTISGGKCWSILMPIWLD
jgi:type I restriction enzyme, R subunit